MTIRRTWRFLLPVAVLVAVAGTAAALLAGARREVTTSSDEAYRLYRQGRENELKLYHREAMADYAEALSHDPHFLMATVRLARASAGKDRNRAEALLSCVGRYRDSVTEKERLLFDIASAQIARDSKTAVERIEEFRRRFPDDPEGFELKAASLLKRGKLDEAIAEYERLLEANPNYAVAYNQLGYHWMQRGDYARAEDYLKRYRFLAPDQANPYDSLGELYANTGRYEEAIAVLGEALKIKPDFYAPIGHLGTVYAGQGRFREAAEQFKKAGAEMSDKGESDFAAAEAVSLVLAGEGGAGLARLAELERQAREGAAPDDLHAILLARRYAHLRVVSEVKLGLTEEAGKDLARLEESLASVPEKGQEDSKEALVRDRRLLDAQLGKPEGLDSLTPKLLPPFAAQAGIGWEYLPGRPLYWVLAAEILTAHGRPGEAAELLKAVLAVNPRFAPAVEALGRARGETTAASLEGASRPGQDGRQ